MSLVPETKTVYRDFKSTKLAKLRPQTAPPSASALRRLRRFDFQKTVQASLQDYLSADKQAVLEQISQDLKGMSLTQVKDKITAQAIQESAVTEGISDPVLLRLAMFKASVRKVVGSYPGVDTLINAIMAEYDLALNHLQYEVDDGLHHTVISSTMTQMQADINRMTRELKNANIQLESLKKDKEQLTSQLQLETQRLTDMALKLNELRNPIRSVAFRLFEGGAFSTHAMDADKATTRAPTATERNDDNISVAAKTVVTTSTETEMEEAQKEICANVEYGGVAEDSSETAANTLIQATEKNYHNMGCYTSTIEWMEKEIKQRRLTAESMAIVLQEYKQELAQEKARTRSLEKQLANYEERFLNVQREAEDHHRQILALQLDHQQYDNLLEQKTFSEKKLSEWKTFTRLLQLECRTYYKVIGQLLECLHKWTLTWKAQHGTVESSGLRELALLLRKVPSPKHKDVKKKQHHHRHPREIPYIATDVMPYATLVTNDSQTLFEPLGYGIGVPHYLRTSDPPRCRTVTLRDVRYFLREIWCEKLFNEKRQGKKIPLKNFMDIHLHRKYHNDPDTRLEWAYSVTDQCARLRTNEVEIDVFCHILENQITEDIVVAMGETLDNLTAECNAHQSSFAVTDPKMKTVTPTYFNNLLDQTFPHKSEERMAVLKALALTHTDEKSGDIAFHDLLCGVGNVICLHSTDALTLATNPMTPVSTFVEEFRRQTLVEYIELLELIKTKLLEAANQDQTVGSC
eukprot:TRINITY_DN67409_c8_g1_i5.p1 TRINITY_DN67409_c8_g1~~TRINITY_DN67409_c8_g1_i5.p1  ORF type:complete len:748 (+),score=64.18 TRINITY_DN67409_c8_g1_i5:88-2331(+)